MSVINTNGFIGVGISINNKELNKMFTRMNKMILDAEYSIVTDMASNLVDFSPVWTGRYVSNWTVNPNSPNEANSGGFNSGAQRRKEKLSDGQAAALKETKKQSLIDRIVSALESERSVSTGMYGNITVRGSKMKNSWFFSNTTPYADSVESRHGVVAGAEVAGHTSISFAKMDNRQI